MSPLWPQVVAARLSPPGRSNQARKLRAAACHRRTATQSHWSTSGYCCGPQQGDRHTAAYVGATGTAQKQLVLAHNPLHALAVDTRRAVQFSGAAQQCPDASLAVGRWVRDVGLNFTTSSMSLVGLAVRPSSNQTCEPGSLLREGAPRRDLHESFSTVVPQQQGRARNQVFDRPQSTAYFRISTSIVCFSSSRCSSSTPLSGHFEPARGFLLPD